MQQSKKIETNLQNGYDDPRWKQKRLEIIGRDSSTCQNCGKTFPRQLLNVHHRCYRQYTSGESVPPWDYQDHELITLCRPCHEKGHELYGQAPVYIISLPINHQ
jgi:5-methylcytosine-specific restriction endonuclease McrA